MTQTVRSLALVLAFLLAAGCGAATGVLAKLAQGVGFLGSAIDVAEAGSEMFFAKHPSQREAEVRRAIMAARQAEVALASALATAKSADDGDLTAARQGAKDTYRALVELMTEMGIPEARSPFGGAEASGDPPEPFTLPSADKMSTLL